MILKSLLITGAAFVLVNASAGRVVLSGTVQDCVGGRPPITVGVPGVSISVFNKAKAPALATLLRNMDAPSTFDEAGMAQLTTQYQQMVSLNNSSTALARLASASNGTFSVSISPIDSVLVVGFAENESQPFFYSYKMLGGRASQSFALDMSRGDCSL